MNKKAGALILFLSLVVLFAVVPLFVNAQSQNQNATGIPYWAPTGLISCTGNPLNNDGSQNSNACTSLCNLIQTFVNIIFFVITICLFVLAPAFFAIGGIMMMLAGANPEMLSRGKSVLLSTVIGLAIVLCSYILVTTFVTVLNTTTSNGAPTVFGASIQCTPQ
jgi:hypothetical protein